MRIEEMEVLPEEVGRFLLESRLREIIPLGLAKVEMAVVDPHGWEEYLRTLGPSKSDSVKAAGEEFLKKRIHSLQAEGAISSPETLAALAERFCVLSPDQMRQALCEYEINFRNRVFHP